MTVSQLRTAYAAMNRARAGAPGTGKEPDMGPW
jgi:hypothetical protein